MYKNFVSTELRVVYFKLFVDGFHVYGGPDLAQFGKKEAAWSFQLPQIRLLNAKIVRVEFYKLHIKNLHETLIFLQYHMRF